MEMPVDHTSAIERGKIFVGGLSWDTTEDMFKKHFESYGEISDAKIMQNQEGNPRGFGFVTFKNPEVVHSVLEDKHFIDNKLVDPKPATKKPHISSPFNSKCKVFLGGLPLTCTEKDIELALQQFGKVTNIDIKSNYPNNTSAQGAAIPGEKKNRGFGFVDFEEAEQADAACKARFITIDSRQVEVKKAEPRKKGTTVAQQDANHYQVSANSYFASSGGVGRVMSGGGVATGNPYHYPYYHPSAYTAAGFSHFPYDCYGRGSYAGQQPLTAYPDASASGFSQHRPTGYGSSSEHYSGGAAAFTNYDQSHLTAAGYYPDQSATGLSYGSHTSATVGQQRGSYANYGRS